MYIYIYLIIKIVTQYQTFAGDSKASIASTLRLDRELVGLVDDALEETRARGLDLAWHAARAHVGDERRLRDGHSVVLDVNLVRTYRTDMVSYRLGRHTSRK